MIKIEARAARIIGEATAKHVGIKKDNHWTWEDTGTDLGWSLLCKEGNPYRDHGRYVVTQERWTQWPGVGIESEDFPYEPEFGEPKRNARKVFARIRRLPYEGVGVIVGRTWKVEGEPNSPTSFSDDYSSGCLGGLQRRIPLYEVALEPFDSKARIVLAYEDDII